MATYSDTTTQEDEGLVVLCNVHSDTEWETAEELPDCKDCSVHRDDCGCPRCVEYRQALWTYQRHQDALLKREEEEDAARAKAFLELGLKLTFLQGNADAMAAAWTARPEEMMRAIAVDKASPPLKVTTCNEDGCLNLTHHGYIFCDACAGRFQDLLRKTASLQEEMEERERAALIAHQERADSFWNLVRLIEPLDREGAPPFIYTRSDGHPLLYGQSVNILFGKPGVGKSYVSLHIMREVIAKGGRCIYVDFEDRPHTVHDRAQSMGLEGEFMKVDSIRYVDHEFFTPESEPARAGAMEWLLEADHPEYSQLVIDAAESAGCPSDGGSVMAWFDDNVNPWYRMQVGVLVLDHLPKRKVQGDTVLGPIGSQAKLGNVKGTALLCSGTAWSRKRDGQITLTVHKDRIGYVGQQGATIATIHGNHVMENGRRVLRLSVEAPSVDTGAAGGEDVDRKVLITLLDAGPQGIQGQRMLRDAAQVKGQVLSESIKGLEAAGLVVVSRQEKAYIYAITEAGKREIIGGEEPEEPDASDDDGRIF